MIIDAFRTSPPPPTPPGPDFWTIASHGSNKRVIGPAAESFPFRRREGWRMKGASVSQWERHILRRGVRPQISSKSWKIHQLAPGKKRKKQTNNPVSSHRPPLANLTVLPPKLLIFTRNTNRKKTESKFPFNHLFVFRYFLAANCKADGEASEDRLNAHLSINA